MVNMGIHHRRSVPGDLQLMLVRVRLHDVASRGYEERIDSVAAGMMHRMTGLARDWSVRAGCSNGRRKVRR